MFEVGDRVVLTTDSTCGHEPGEFGTKGMTGTVLEICNPSISSEKDAAYVKFDERVNNGTNWYVYIEELDFISKIIPYTQFQTGDTEEDI